VNLRKFQVLSAFFILLIFENIVFITFPSYNSYLAYRLAKLIDYPQTLMAICLKALQVA